MANRRALEIHYPLGGLSKRMALQSQPPYTTPLAVNVRPRGSESLRLRGGSRPMLEKTHATQLGGGSPVRLLNTVLSLPVSTSRTFVDEFNDASIDSSKWESGNQWFTGRVREVSTFAGETASNAEDQEQGLVAILADPIDSNQPYAITSDGFGIPGDGDGHIYHFYAGLDESSPNGLLNCVYAKYFVQKTSNSPATYRHTIEIYEVVNGVTSSPSGTVVSNGSSPAGVTLTFNIDGSTATLSLSGPFSKSHTKTIGALVGHRVAFGMKHDTPSSTLAQINRFRVSYQEAVSISPNMLVASAGGELRYENASNILTAAGGNLTLASDHGIQSVDRLGILYIADWGPELVSGVAGAVGNATIVNGVLDMAGVTWDTLGIDVDDHVVELYDLTVTSGSIPEGVYAISTIHATDGLTLAGLTTEDASDLGFRVLRGPKQFNSSNATLSALVATVGVAPLGCRLVTVFNDRLVWAGGPTNEVFASRQGDPLDYDYGASDLDQGRAWAELAGDITKIPEPTIALIACSSDYLLFGCANSLWMLVGDITYGGRIINLSRTVGIVGPEAWCHGPEGQIIFLSRGGIYGLPPGAGAFPQPIQEELPDELRDIDPSTNEILLEYDVADQGVHIYVTPIAPGATQHFWLDWPTKTFVNVEMPSAFEPTAITAHRSSGSQVSDVVLGGRDGYLRRFSRTAVTDDGTVMNSSVLCGPFHAGGGLLDGMITEIVGKLSLQSGDVNWAILAGNDHEACVASGDIETGTWHAGLNATEHVRVRGASVALRIDATGPWEVEQMMAVVESLGRQRVA